MLLETDTIVAIATPPGRGAIGIVRLSGPEALTLATPLLALNKPLTPGRPRLVSILDPATRQPLDQALVTFFAAPRSFTTQHVLELACHGAPVLLDFLVRTLVARGARLAQPGEFTQRAFLAGRIDLTQAEAIHDLVAATTLHQARTAAAQLGGSLSRAIAPAKHSLVVLIAQLEAGVDFVEDDLDLLPPEAILTQLEAIHQPLAALAATFPAGHLLRTGFTLALVGRPNAGKSSLFNALLGRPRAIVTAQPGTTRDPIAEPLALEGIPLTLLDTAGLRDLPATPDTEAELAGITRSRAALAESDLILLVIDSTHPPHPEDTATLATLVGRPHLVAHTKADLAPASPGLPAGHLRVSALTGAGLPALRQAILAAVGANPTLDSPLTTIRQQTTIENALTAIAKARSAAHAQLPHELLLLDLYAALTALDELTGATTANDILNRIFSTFCIGK